MLRVCLKHWLGRYSVLVTQGPPPRPWTHSPRFRPRPGPRWSTTRSRRVSLRLPLALFAVWDTSRKW